MHKIDEEARTLIASEWGPNLLMAWILAQENVTFLHKKLDYVIIFKVDFVNLVITLTVGLVNFRCTFLCCLGVTIFVRTSSSTPQWEVIAITENVFEVPALFT